MFQGADGTPSAAEDILDNEIASILQFVQTTPSYDPQKGIVLIGGSYGSWLSLKTIERFPTLPIKGVVFLSPAILPYWVQKGLLPLHLQKLYKWFCLYNRV